MSKQTSTNEDLSLANWLSLFWKFTGYFLDIYSASLSSEEKTILLNISYSHALLMFQSTIGLPLNSRKFFLGNLLDPDLAGITAKEVYTFTFIFSVLTSTCFLLWKIGEHIIIFLI